MILKIPGLFWTKGGDKPVTFEIDVTSYACDCDGNIEVEVGDSLVIRFRDPEFVARQAAKEASGA